MIKVKGKSGNVEFTVEEDSPTIAMFKMSVLIGLLGIRVRDDINQVRRLMRTDVHSKWNRLKKEEDKALKLMHESPE